MNPYTISPLDGRYWEQTQKLAEYFSEYAYIKYRVKVEVEYVKRLCAFLKKPEPKFTWGTKLELTSVDIAWIKNKEKIVKHDVKAIEYFVKEHIDKDSQELVHFGLTSQDVNSVAISSMLKNWVHQEYTPKLTAKLHRCCNMSIFSPGDLVQILDVPDQSRYIKTFVGKYGMILSHEPQNSSKNIWKVLIQDTTVNLHSLDMKKIA